MSEPKTLYHYTDQNGFLGIIQNKELWATKIQFLNDSSEYTIALNILKDYIENIDPEKVTEPITIEGKYISLDDYKEIASTLIEKRINETSIYVCSFSEHPDLLSQWRGYSKSSGGYSVGFSFDEVLLSLRGKRALLEKCVYSPEESKKKIIDKIESLFENKTLSKTLDS